MSILARGTPLALVALLACGGQTPPPDRYEIFAVQYGELHGFPAAGLVLGADTARRVDLSMMVWLLRGGGRTILVDAGFYRPQFLASWDVKDYQRPDSALLRAGVRAEDVTDIIVSHLHWDHADGADLFPNATVWLQDGEYRYYQDTVNQRRTGVFPVDVAMIEAIKAAGRLRLVAGDSQAVAPGVTVFTGGRHTRESQYVLVDGVHDRVVIASDNVYLFENLTGRRPIAATWDTVSNLAAQRRMVDQAAPDLVVPGHDPAVMQRFPTAGVGVVRIQ